MDLNETADLRNEQPIAGSVLTEDESGNGKLDGQFGLHQLLHALQAMRIGDFSVRLPSDRTGFIDAPLTGLAHRPARAM